MSLFGFKKHKKKRAGLFIDRGYFRYLTVVGLPGSYVVTDAVSGELSEEVTQGGDPFTSNGMYLYQVMNEILHNVGSIDVPVRLSLPTTDSLLRVVNFPNMSLYEAKLAFRYEFENYFPFPIEEGIFDLAEIFYPLQNGTEEPRFLVGAARRTLIENITKAAKANGIEITAIEPAQVALERAVTPAAPVSDACVYIYAGKIRSVIIFSWKGNGIFYTMSIGLPGFPSLMNLSMNSSQRSTAHSRGRSTLHCSLPSPRLGDSSRTYSFSLVPGRLRISANSSRNPSPYPRSWSPTQFRYTASALTAAQVRGTSRSGSR